MRIVLNVAIVDDDCTERGRLKEYLAYVEQIQEQSFSVQEYDSAERFLMLFEQQFDIVFMDIKFSDGMDGMSAARRMRAIDANVILIFVTNLAQMAIHGYEVDALDFMVKPLEKYAFQLKMRRALGRIQPRERQLIQVRCNGGDIYLDTRNIRYLEVDGHYVIYHTREGDFTEYISLTGARKKLDDPAFFRCDRGLMINMRMLSRIEGDSCVVDGKQLTVAHSQKSELKRAFAEFLSGRRKKEGA